MSPCAQGIVKRRLGEGLYTEAEMAVHKGIIGAEQQVKRRCTNSGKAPDKERKVSGQIAERHRTNSEKAADEERGGTGSVEKRHRAKI